MKVVTQSVNFKADPELVKFVEERVSKLEKFYDKIIDAEVYLKVQQTSEKEDKVVEVKINIPNETLMVQKETKTIEEGLNLCLDVLKRLLKRVKEKNK